MKLKLLATYLTLVVCAAFAPAASASPQLTELGSAIAPGTTVTAQSEKTIWRTDYVGSYRCTNSDMHGTVVKNVASQIMIEFTAVSFTDSGGAPCANVGGGQVWKATNLPWCMRFGAELGDSFTLTGGKCSEAPKPIQLTINSGCNYVSSETAFTGTYSTKTIGVGLTTGVGHFEGATGLLCRPFDLDPIKYHLTTAVSPFTGLTIS